MGAPKYLTAQLATLRREAVSRWRIDEAAPGEGRVRGLRCTLVYLPDRRHVGVHATRYLDAWDGLKPGGGAGISVGVVPESVKRFYGRRVNFAFGVFVTIRTGEPSM